MNHSVGQILYVVFKKDNKVVPVQVVEEVTRKTLDGLKIDYILKVGSDGDTTISLEHLLKEAEVFGSVDETIETLSTRARSSIEKIVSNAVKKSKEWYGSTRSTEQHVTNDHFVTSHLEDETVNVVLPDGTIARARMPQVIGQ